MTDALYETNLQSLKLRHRGKGAMTKGSLGGKVFPAQ